MERKNIKIAVGMSGGVDSSVAAKILKDQGYNVVGFMMKLWGEGKKHCKARDPSTYGSRGRENACCDIEGVEDAKRVAQKLGIPFYVVDVREKFKKEIVDYFLKEYKNLRTPNPCVKCNEKIKFGWLLDFAKKTGCDYLATGHYARVASDLSFTNSQFPLNEKMKNDKINGKWKMENGKYHLLKGVDENKDQSYFLYRLNQEQLSKIIFPVGDYSKAEVRAMAKKWKLPVHEKKESQEICFIQEKDYRVFLRRYIPKSYFKPGEIVDSAGNIVGKHEGLINYTIGQRRGIEQDTKYKIQDTRNKQISKSKLQISNKNLNSKFKILNSDKRPLYVVGFDVEKNRLIVGENSEIFRNEMTITDCHFISERLNAEGLKQRDLTIKIRYRHAAVACHPVLDTGSSLDSRFRGNDKKRSGNDKKGSRNDKLVVRFEEKQRAITPGQSAVLYYNDEVLGGGIISE
ncbi:MAG: tRNA 2-thiouridine(34) synthase MnmA [bacterium]|nr:tRNA 2-thiouridine(34) synthase MnmA [bacterium]